MNKSKRLSAAVVLMLVMSLSVLAGETSSPPCAPGDILTPPCASAQAPSNGDAGTPTLASTSGQTETPPSSDFSLGEIAASVFWSLLPLY